MKNLILKILPIALAVVLLQLAVTAESKAAPPVWGCGSGGSHYVVCYGDTLFSIGRQFNKDPYCIANYNGLNPDWIYAGQVIYIPDGCGSYPWWGHRQTSCWDDCDQGWQEPSKDRCDWGCDGYEESKWDCGNDCNKGGWGYDRTGYYYDQWNSGYQRYSYTCGYGGNCY